MKVKRIKVQGISKLMLILGSLFIFSTSLSQDDDKRIIRKIFDNVLLSEKSYNKLEQLCIEAPGRLLGSMESYTALDIMQSYFDEIGADTVFLQEFQTPAWLHHRTVVSMLGENMSILFHADALGPSSSTPEGGLVANVIEVQGLEELKTMDTALVKGKIVFFNRSVDMTHVNTFRIYGSAVDQRVHGPALAAEMGAVAALIRSVGTRIDKYPHTGSTRFNGKKIPCAAISTMDADMLSDALREENTVAVKMVIEAEDLEEITTYNLIADVRGSEFPDEYIIVGGHIDTWFNSPGAHDDGIGCLQSADVMRIFKELGLNNKRTLRIIMFMDEELYQSGGQAYAEFSEENDLINYFALEADAGGFTPVGFNIDAPDSIVSVIARYQKLLGPYGINYIRKGGSGVDISPLKEFNVPLAGFRTDSQRYMDLHHSAYDTFDKVHIREMQLGSGCMAALIYLIDKYGL